jgi:hypothetical protein
MSRERIGDGPGRPNMVNGTLARRFACGRAVPCAESGGGREMGKKVTPAVRIRRDF